MSFSTIRPALLLLLVVASPQLRSQAPAPQLPGVPGTKNPSPAKPPASTSPAGGQSGNQGGDSKSASGSEAKSASGKQTRLSPIDPATAPPWTFKRPRIGLALGGGGALGLSEVGVLQWFEENHIPVDVIAGTSMGCMVSALYATGRSPLQVRNVVNDRVFTSVFSFSNSYTSRSFRRRQDSRDLPNAITIGLSHGVSFRNAVLTDQGLNAFLDREFLRYDDQTDFNTLPIPLRCVSTDLNDAVPATFSRGSIPDAVRASVSLPGIFQPYEMNGHEYVDGGVLENLPTRQVHEMKPDVVLAVSIPLAPVGQGDLGSILGVLGRSFSVGIEAAEREQRKNADVVIIPDLKGLSSTDYLKVVDLSQRGYQAAESHRAELIKYSVSEADWSVYLAHRASLVRGPAGPVLRIRVTAPDHSATIAVQRLFAPLVNQPVDTRKIEALLDQVRSDGAYEADYTIGYETAQQFAAQTSGRAPIPGDSVPVAAETTQSASTDTSKPTERQQPGAPNPKVGTASTSSQPGVADHPGAPGLAATREATPESLADIAARPIILVTVARKKTGPPFLLAGVNIQSQTTAFTRATIEGILLNQDLGGYGSELRSTVKLGYVTEFTSEYFRPVFTNDAGDRVFFVSPQGDFQRKPYPIYVGPSYVANRQLQMTAGGADIGFTNKRTQDLRAGIDFEHVSWTTTIGSDGLPNQYGNAQRARIHYEYDTQDRALIPQFGLRAAVNAGYLFTNINRPFNVQSAPLLDGRISFAHRFSLKPTPTTAAETGPTKRGRQVFVIATEGGTLFDRNIAEPFRYTLGGPLRLSASAIDQYRGTDYWLVEPAILRRIAQLPSPLGQAIYLGLGLEAGQMRAPGVPTITREDGYFGIVAETPLGAITLAPAIGSNGERKFVFTLGKLF
jgi:NTE family protein